MSDSDSENECQRPLSESHEANRRYAVPAYAYDRLKCLYDISKCLVHFESTEKTVPKILSLVAGTFPLLSAVLVEHVAGAIVTTIWPTSGMTNEQQKAIVTNARASFAYLVESSPANLQSQAVTKGLTIPDRRTHIPERSQRDDLLVIPLVMSRFLGYCKSRVRSRWEKKRSGSQTRL